MNPLKMTIAFLVCSTTRPWTTGQSARTVGSVRAFSSTHRFARRAHRSASSLASQIDARTSTSQSSEAEEEAELKKSKGREKRQKFVGLAKAVDRGRFAPYDPLKNGKFEALSGLPRKLKEGKLFTVLGIESSCDDTGAAILRSDGTILGESLVSQHSIHQPFGGVVPSLAKSAHEDNIHTVIETALHNAGMKMEDVDAVGVTVGPGLEICLRVGCERAKELAGQYGKPFVGVHHLEAHILMARIPSEKYDNTQTAPETTATPVRAMEFPFLALLVSGGHCQILKCLGIGQYTILGGTLDDSLGEAFDKTARLLGLPVGGGGGPAIEKLALDGDPDAIALPIPLQKRKDCDFSYAGLKTAVRLASEKLRDERGVESVEDLPRSDKADIAASFQHTAFRHLEIRLERAMSIVEEEDGIRSLAVVGGVAANKALRSRLSGMCTGRSEEWKMCVPPPRLCTDQGAMSAWAAVERLMVGSSDVIEGQEVFARYPFAVMNGNE